MSDRFLLTKEVIEYNTSHDVSSAPDGTLIAGSQNVLIDGRQGKVISRGGYTRFGVANTTLTPVKGEAPTWDTSTGTHLPMRQYDVNLEAYLGTVDGVAINAYTLIASGLHATNPVRFTTWFNSTENLDLLLYVDGGTEVNAWNGGVAVVDSVGANTITKKGTNTFAQSRFFTASNKSLTCVRTSTTYTYTAGEGTLTLTGTSATAGLVSGDILVQTPVVTSNVVGSSRYNATIFNFENQIYYGSNLDPQAYISKNTDYTTFSFSAPRIAGEGGLLTLTDTVRGFGNLAGKAVTFCGRSSMFESIYTQITVGTTLTEALTAKPVQIGLNQGAFNQECIVPVGNSLVYLTNEPAIRELRSVENAVIPTPKTLSNPIQPDFDAEDFTNANAVWVKNNFIITSRVNSRMYILGYLEDADGRLRRFWNPPQILPVGTMSIINGELYGHSNAVPETYLLFDGNSDGNYVGIDPADKLPINATAKFSYKSFAIRARSYFISEEDLKNFDEYYVKGEISPSTKDLLLSLNYDFEGATQKVERTIDGTDDDILFGLIPNVSLAQNPLAEQPLGGSRDIPADTKRFEVVFEIAKEDFRELSATFSTNEVDRFWSVIAHGPNMQKSSHKNINIKK